MSEAAAAEAPEGEKPAAPVNKDKSLLFVLVNLIFSLAAIGMLIYTKLIFKRPSITNAQELARIAKEAEKKKKLEEANPEKGLVMFDPVNINIKPTHAFSTPGDPSGKIEGKMHTATLGFAMELRDVTLKGGVEDIRPLLYDRLLSLMGRKAYTELVTVQGRYLLKNQILDIVNQLLMDTEDKSDNDHDTDHKSAEAEETAQNAKEIIITNIYFTHFVVQ